MATLGYKVIAVDADLGGANLHACFGVDKPKYTMLHFFSGQCKSLNSIVYDTQIPNLKLVSGESGAFGLANIKYFQKLAFIREIKKLPADYIFLDLGAGSSFNVIDFFNTADQGVVVTTPESIAIQETFNFLKFSFIRKLRRSFVKNELALKYIDRFVLASHQKPNYSFLQFLDWVKSNNSDLYHEIEIIQQKYQPQLILNMVRTRKEFEMGKSLQRLMNNLLAIDLELLGTIEYNDLVHYAVNENKPYVLHNPKAKTSKDLTKITTQKIISNSWIQQKIDAQKVRYTLSSNSMVEKYTEPKLCVYSCAEWATCDLRNGGYHCMVKKDS